MKLIKNNKEKGFTLIELVVVIAILAILALILIPAISGYVNKASDSKDLANARSVYTAAMVVDAEENTGDFKSDEVPTKFAEELNKMLDLPKDVEYIVTKTNGKLSVEVGDKIYPELP